MTARIRSVGWLLVFLVLVALSVPWFLWGAAATVGGLPVWLWWHVGWLLVTAGVFYVFTRTDWGIWVGVKR